MSTSPTLRPETISFDSGSRIITVVTGDSSLSGTYRVTIKASLNPQSQTTAEVSFMLTI